MDAMKNDRIFQELVKELAALNYEPRRLCYDAIAAQTEIMSATMDGSYASLQHQLVCALALLGTTVPGMMKKKYPNITPEILDEMQRVAEEEKTEEGLAYKLMSDVTAITMKMILMKRRPDNESV